MQIEPSDAAEDMLVLLGELNQGYIRAVATSDVPGSSGISQPIFSIPIRTAA